MEALIVWSAVVDPGSNLIDPRIRETGCIPRHHLPLVRLESRVQLLNEKTVDRISRNDTDLSTSRGIYLLSRDIDQLSVRNRCGRKIQPATRGGIVAGRLGTRWSEDFGLDRGKSHRFGGCRSRSGGGSVVRIRTTAHQQNADDPRECDSHVNNDGLTEKPSQ